MLNCETKKNMKFEIDDYDLQAEGTYGKFQWLFHNGNLWIYRDYEGSQYMERIEKEIQIDPFSTEKDIKDAVENTVRVTDRKYTWEYTKTKIQKPTVMSIYWSKKLIEELKKSCLFDVLNVENQ